MEMVIIEAAPIGGCPGVDCSSICFSFCYPVYAFAASTYTLWNNLDACV